jgi:ATP-dependent Lhr-like helicase
MSTAFDALHVSLQRWIHRQGWQQLRPIQEAAIQPILTAEQDVILAATTASGKTEAAFLPVLSYLLTHEDELETGCQVLYVAPLKALINDQTQRLTLMVDNLNIKVTPWHGDIAGSRKQKLLKSPDGVLLITPESVESLMVNHGTQLRRLFPGLQYIIIDELHAYIGTERGIQLQSLLHRIELSLRRRVPRIGLSATLGDMSLAAEYLRPGHGAHVNMIESHDEKQALRLQVRGYLSEPPNIDALAEEGVTDRVLEEDERRIAQHLFDTLRGSQNLIFANSRNKVETYADWLRDMCEQQRVPIAFLPHHGSLSKDIREFAEETIKEGTKPTNIICTSTLEMGIDIGSVESIAQVGSPFSVASMRQRLGRSGRRGEPATLRTYIREEQLGPLSSIAAQLRFQLIQAIAMTELLLEKWCEPPDHSGLQLSTLIQQILSVIAQHGGATAEDLWKALCIDAPFSHVPQSVFIDLLRRMGEKELLTQSVDGTLLHGRVGEVIVNHYTFYTAFNTPDEFTLLTGGKRLGTLPIDFPVQENSFMIFAGKRWRVLRVDLEKQTIDLSPAKGGKVPNFGGEGGAIHREIRQRMLSLYQRDDMPRFLDHPAQVLFDEGRNHFARYDLANQWLLKEGNDVHLFFWEGDIVHNTIAALLLSLDYQAECDGTIITVMDARETDVLAALQDIADDERRTGEELAENVSNKWIGKYDKFLSQDLMNINYASQRFDVGSAYRVLDARLTADTQL